MKTKVMIFGAGYVGLSIGILLSQKHQVVMIDNDDQKINAINSKKLGLEYSFANKLLEENQLNLIASADYSSYIDEVDIVILSLPTNFDDKTNFFDTSLLESVIKNLNSILYKGIILIKSTTPIGFTSKIKNIYKNLNIVFSPEFLREGNAIEDSIKPSRIIIGDTGSNGKVVADLLFSITNNSPKIYYMNSTEAEAVKLFANTYLANRISFFNELDSFCLEGGLDTQNIIEGICSDNRIGFGYNNPSFGYGGYCLPKDSKQLLANFSKIPQGIFSAVIESNKMRKNLIASKIINLSPTVVGVYRLSMKLNSNNYRESAILDILKIINEYDIKILIYEPFLKDNDSILGYELCNDIQSFIEKSDLILANRIDKEITHANEKIFTRDIFNEN